MAYFGKTFNMVGEENFAAFIDSMGIPEERKTHLKQSKPSNKLEKNADGSYTITVSSPEYTNTLTFKSGVEFDEKVSDNNTAKTTVTVEGDTFTQVQKFSTGASMTTKKEFSENDLKVTITSSFWDGVAYRYYKAQ